MSKFATVVATDLTIWKNKEKELEELNKYRMEKVGFTSNYAKIVLCPFCGKQSLAAPGLPKTNGNGFLPGWERKSNPRDLAIECNPPNEEEKKALAEREKAQKSFDEAQADIGKLLQKLSKGKPAYISSSGELIEEKSKFVDEAEALLKEAKKILDKKGELLQKANVRYNELHRQRMLRIQQYRENLEKKAQEQIEQAKQAKKGKNWRKKIKEIIST